MKTVAFILSVLIFSTSLKAGVFVESFSNAVNGDSVVSSCCSSQAPSDTCDLPLEDSEKKDNCCDGPACHCTCCVHIACIQDYVFEKFEDKYSFESKFGYSFSYHIDFYTSIFHPPSIS